MPEAAMEYQVISRRQRVGLESNDTNYGIDVTDDEQKKYDEHNRLEEKSIQTV